MPPSLHRLRATDLPALTGLTVVSPHLDDAVLSCFALLRAADRPTVMTVFAGLPPVGTPPQFYDRLTGSADPRRRMRDRRAEDRAALACVGARPVHLDLLDGPYRQHAVALDELVDTIAGAVPRRTTVLAAPGGFGGHPDHQAVADAVPLVADRLGIEVIAFADYPYAATYGWPAWVTGGNDDPLLQPEATWGRARERLGRHGLLDEVVVSLPPALRREKLTSFGCYVSQVPVCEMGPARMVSHPARLGHELWFRRPAEAHRKRS